MTAHNSKISKKINNIRFFKLLLLLFCMHALLFSKTLVCAREENVNGYNGRHLIQTTNVVEEYKGLQELGFLNTGKAEGEGAAQIDSTEENLSEYSRLLQSFLNENAYVKAQGAIVQIHMGEYYGSGVIWDLHGENIIIVSNAHLFMESEKGMVTFSGGVSAQGTVLTTSKTKDIGFLEVALSDLAREDWLRLRFANQTTTAYDSLTAGDALFVIGSASGVGADIYDGTVGNPSYYFPEFDSNMLYGYCQAEQGMSGGGTFDKNGCFLGMITAGTEQGEIASLPVTVIKEEYRALFK